MLKTPEVDGLGRIVLKVQCCLALAVSGNLVEVERGLRLARTLLDGHWQSQRERPAGDVALRGTGKVRGLVPDWQRHLAEAAAEIFSCRMTVERQSKGGGIDRVETTFQFYGEQPAAELAGYAYDALLDQITAARRTYFSTLNNDPEERRSRADVFCDAWALGLRSRLADLLAPAAVPETITPRMLPATLTSSVHEDQEPDEVAPSIQQLTLGI